MLVEVLVPRPLYNSYFYKVPEALRSSVSVGRRVEISFGSQTLIGCVIKLIEPHQYDSCVSGLEKAEFRDIDNVLEDFAFLDEQSLELIAQVSRHYLVPPGQIAALLLPRYQPQSQIQYKLESDLTNLLERAPRSRKKLRQGLIRMAMSEIPVFSKETLLEITEWKSGLLRDALRLNLLVEIFIREQLVSEALPNFDLFRSEWPELSEQQAVAYKGISECGETVQYLKGVTGSGKTEVYLNLTFDCLKNGQNTIFLVPEIALTPQFVNIFKSRFGDLVTVFHSRINDKQKYEEWKLLLQGRRRVVIGARSALFSPVPNLGLIILDEEGEGSYKQDSSPFYDARRVAELKVKIAGGKLVMGSATPSLNAWNRIQSGEIPCQRMDQRHNQFELPKISVVDLRQEFKEGNFSVFSRELKNKMQREIGRGNQVILFVNRRGHSSFVMCRQCSHSLSCPRCDLSLTYHDSEILHCHYCGFFNPKPSQCPQCNSKAIKQFGLGTQKVESFFRREFPGVSMARLDTDVSNQKGYTDSVLEGMRQKDIQVLIGTQMISKGLDFEDSTLVGIMNPDSLVKMGDFSAREKAFQLFVQIAGRCGRSHKKGEVILQTYTPEMEIYRQLCSYDLNQFIEQELRVREALQFPPYCRMVYIESNSEIEQKAIENLERVHQMLLKIPANMIKEIYEPQACPIAKINHRYRYRCVVKAADVPEFWEEIEVIRKSYRSLNRTRTKFLVDPESLL